MPCAGGLCFSTEVVDDRLRLGENVLDLLARQPGDVDLLRRGSREERPLRRGRSCLDAVIDWFTELAFPAKAQRAIEQAIREPLESNRYFVEAPVSHAQARSNRSLTSINRCIA